MLVALRDGDKDLRLAAVALLGKVEAEASIDGLAVALKDPDAGVRANAVGVLASLEGERPLDILLESIGDVAPLVRWAALSAIAARDRARGEHRYGASRTRVWLQRVHGVSVNARTIQRVFRDLGFPRLTRTPKRRARQLRLFEKDQPGDSIQVDVKVAGRKVFQCTALDDCTRLRVLRLYPRLNHWSSLHFFGELQRALPFPIKKLQCDYGTEFPLAFALRVQEAGIRHRYIKPRRPQQNGKVERSHRIDHDEFWGRSAFRTFEEADAALQEWEHRYSYERFSLALHGQTPVERLQQKLASMADQQRTVTTDGESEHGPLIDPGGRAQLLSVLTGTQS